VTKPWNIASDETKLSLLRAALERVGGSITLAAEELDLSRQQVTNLVRQFELKEFAAQLRLQHGGVRVRGGERSGVVLGRTQKPVNRDPESK